MDKGSGQVGDKTRRWAALALTCVVAALCVGISSGTASASPAKVAAPVQDCPDYPNCPPNGTNPTPTIETDADVYVSGSDVRVKACGYVAGSGASGTITYRGDAKIPVAESGSGCMAPSTTTGTGAGAGLEVAAAGDMIVITQTAAFPSGRFTANPVGSGDVCSVAAGYSTPCKGISITGVESARGGGGGGLAFTGFELALFLALALILLVVGANLVQWSRRRRRRMAREREAAHAQAHRQRQLTNR